MVYIVKLNLDKLMMPLVNRLLFHINLFYMLRHNMLKMELNKQHKVQNLYKELTYKQEFKQEHQYNLRMKI